MSDLFAIATICLLSFLVAYFLCSVPITLWRIAGLLERLCERMDELDNDDDPFKHHD